jgi:hypothetical protein
MMDTVRFVRLAVALLLDGYWFCLSLPLVVLVILSVRNILLVAFARGSSWWRNR